MLRLFLLFLSALRGFVHNKAPFSVSVIQSVMGGGAGHVNGRKRIAV